MINLFLTNFTVDSRGSCLDEKKKPYLLPPFLLYGILKCMVMKEINLTQGKVTLVDDDDFDYLSQFNWCAIKTKYTCYAVRQIKDIHGNCRQRHIWMHREIISTPSELVCDHVDHDGLNNQKSNLRNCSVGENNRNVGKSYKVNYIGVTYNRGKYINANITVKGKTVRLGTFKTEVAAAIAYDEAAKKHHGEFANLNFKE